MGVAGIGLQADGREQDRHSLAALPAVADSVDGQRLADDRSDRPTRIERGVRILEDDLHFAPSGAHRRPRQSAKIPALETYPALRRLDQPQDQARQRRFAATRLADDAKGLAPVEAQAHTVHGLNPARPALGREVLGQSVDFEQRPGPRVCAANARGFQQATR